MTTEIKHDIEKENHLVKGVYVAVTLPKELQEYWQYALKTSLTTDKTHDNPIRLKKRFSSTSRTKPHMTIGYFGDIPMKTYRKLDDFITGKLDLLDGSTIQIDLPVIIGDKNRALVAPVKPSEGILEFRSKLEESFPEVDFPHFLPHYTFDEIKRGKITLAEARQATTFMYPGLPTQSVKIDEVYIGRKN